MAGNDRGNMRCFEALGCGALLLSDEGDYPLGIHDRLNVRMYRDASSAVSIVEEMLENEPMRANVALRGFHFIRSQYSKARQWHDFQHLVHP
jgi:spore maturation protein CgeB